MNLDQAVQYAESSIERRIQHKQDLKGTRFEKLRYEVRYQERELRTDQYIALGYN